MSIDRCRYRWLDRGVHIYRRGVCGPCVCVCGPWRACVGCILVYTSSIPQWVWVWVRGCVGAWVWSWAWVGVEYVAMSRPANTRSSEKFFFAARPKKYTSAINTSYDGYRPLKHPYNDLTACVNRSIRHRFRSHARARRFDVVYAPFPTLLRRL